MRSMSLSRNSMSLSRKMMLFFSAILLTSLVLLAVLSYNYARVPLHQASQAAGQRLAAATAERLNGWIQSRSSELRAMSLASDVKSMDWGKAEPYLVDAVSSASTSKSFASVWLAGSDGKAKSTTGIAMELDNNPLIQQVLAGKSAVIGGAAGFTDTLKLVLPIVYPVRDAANQVRGVLGAGIDMEEISALIATTKIGNLSYTFLIDQEGTIVSHPDPEVLGRNLQQHESSSIRSAAGQMMAGAGGSTEFIVDGATKELFFAPVGAAHWSLGLVIDYAELTAPLAKLRHNSIVAGSVLVVVAAILTWLISYAISRPLQQAAAASQRFASGDLRERLAIRGGGEIAVLSAGFNHMADSLSTTVRDIKTMTGAVQEIADGLSRVAGTSLDNSRRVTATVMQVAEGSSETAVQTETGVEILQQLAAAIDHVAASSQSASEAADDAEQAVQQGLRAIAQQNEVASQGIAASHQIATAINGVAAQFKEVYQVVDVIRSIAKRTHLLALNASIEAANAGEYGRGFAVVANEVRRLAEQSNLEVQKIEQIVGRVASSTDHIAQQTTVLVKTADDQAAGLSESDASFARIRQSIHRIVMSVQEEAALAEQMAASTDEVVGAVRAIANRSTDTAASVQQISAAMQQVAATSEQLDEATARINAMIDALSRKMDYFRLQ